MRKAADQLRVAGSLLDKIRQKAGSLIKVGKSFHQRQEGDMQEKKERKS